MKRIEDFIHHLFVPSRKNSYRARTLHIDMLTGYLMAAILMGFLYRALPGSNLGQMILGVATDITPQQLLECTNKHRREQGLNAVSLDTSLSSAAQLKAQHMFEHDYWSHYGPAGETPWSFILKAGYDYEYAGENLAKNFLFSKDVCDAWIASPTHRDNMLRDIYTNVGFAVVDGVLEGETTTLVVQMLGRSEGERGEQGALVAQVQAQETAPTSAPEPTQLPVQVLESKTTTTDKTTTSSIAGFDVMQLEISLIFMALLMIALIVDLYYAHRIGILRISGKHIAHLVFVGAILIGLLILSKGTITTQAAFL